MVAKWTRLIQQAFLDEKVDNPVSAAKRIITERKAQHGLECENSTLSNERKQANETKVKKELTREADQNSKIQTYDSGTHYHINAECKRSDPEPTMFSFRQPGVRFIHSFMSPRQPFSSMMRLRSLSQSSETELWSHVALSASKHSNAPRKSSS